MSGRACPSARATARWRSAALLACLLLLTACDSSAPDAAALLQRTSEHMKTLKGFHFLMEVQGDLGSVGVQRAEGDAKPPDMHATIGLRHTQVLLEVEVILTGQDIYLKSFTGGWQRLTPQEVANFFDVHALFDPGNGLFGALPDTGQPARGKQETVSSHAAYVITGKLPAARVHRLLPVAREQGDYAATYWIESPGDTLWKASVSGNLFDASQSSTITFTFSRHDQPVAVTPPALR